MSVLLLNFLAVCTLSGCADARREQLEQWDSQKRSAFQAFRDRKYDEAVQAYSKALDIARGINADGAEVAITLTDLATVKRVQGQEGEASALLQQSASILEKRVNSDNLNKQSMRAYSETLEQLAKIKHKSGDLLGAEADYSKAISIAERANESSKLRELVFEYKSVLQEEGKDDLVQTVSDRYSHLSDQEQLPDRNSHIEEQAKRFLSDGETAIARGDAKKAEECYQEAARYARDSKDISFRGHAFGRVALYLYATHQYEQAEQAIRSAMRDFRAAHVSDKDMRPYLICFASIEKQLGKFKESETAARLVLKVTEQNYGKDSLEMSEALQAVVNALVGQHKYAEALPLFTRSYDIVKARVNPATPQVVMHMCWLSNVYWLAGRTDAARSIVDSYARNVVQSGKSGAELNLVGRLLNDFGEECSKTDKKEAAVYYAAAAHVAKPAPEAAGELKRALSHLKALQTPAAT